jgi:O-antigen ligase
LFLFAKEYAPLSSIFSGSFSRFQSLTEKGASPVNVRFLEYEVILKNFVKQPVFGWGLGATFTYYRPWLQTFRTVAYTHNFFTYLLLYLGLIGFFSFLYLMFTLIRFLFEQRRRHDLFINAVSDAFILSTIGVLFYAQFQAIHKTFFFNIFLAILIGVSARMKILQVESESKECESEINE